MNGGRGILIVFLGIFLAVTGGIAIISSLLKIHNVQEGKISTSTLETKLFKWSAPTALSYGILAILSVIGLIYFDKLSEIKFSNISSSGHGVLKNQNIYEFDSLAACSIISGSVVVKLNSGFSEESLQFQGVAGLSNNPNGPFSGNQLPIKTGDQIYIRRFVGDIWVVNILKDGPNVKLEVSPFPPGK